MGSPRRFFVENLNWSLSESTSGGSFRGLTPTKPQFPEFSRAAGPDIRKSGLVWRTQTPSVRKPPYTVARQVLSILPKVLHVLPKVLHVLPKVLHVLPKESHVLPKVLHVLR